MIKKIDISKIQAVKILNAHAWSVKVYFKYYSCIAISSRKTIKQADVEDAYNHKKRYYIIFPNTSNNMQKLQEAYIKALGKELEIN